MKKLMLFFAATFLLQLSVFGQNRVLLQENSPYHQADLISAEMMSMVRMIIEDPNLLLKQENLPLGLEHFQGDFSVEITIEYVVINEFNPANWDRPLMDRVISLDSFPLIVNNNVDFFDPLNAGHHWSWGTPIPSSYGSLQSSANERQSIMYLVSLPTEIELDNNEWRLNGGTPDLPTKVSSFGDWQFNIGPEGARVID